MNRKKIDLTNHFNVCDLHLKRNENDPFLKQIITGNKKWIAYNNVNRKRRLCHQKKIMRSFWWDRVSVVYVVQ